MELIMEKDLVALQLVKQNIAVMEFHKKEGVNFAMMETPTPEMDAVQPALLNSTVPVDPGQRLTAGPRYVSYTRFRDIVKIPHRIDQFKTAEIFYFGEHDVPLCYRS